VFDGHVPLAKVGEHEHEAGLEAMVAREFLPDDVEVHHAARVVDHVHGPPSRILSAIYGA
jgi:hypothetical protein